jgi:hypothetical protein
VQSAVDVHGPHSFGWLLPQICPPVQAGAPVEPVVERQVAVTQLDAMQRLPAYALLHTASAWSPAVPFASHAMQLHVPS